MHNHNHNHSNALEYIQIVLTKNYYVNLQNVYYILYSYAPSTIFYII